MSERLVRLLEWQDAAYEARKALVHARALLLQRAASPELTVGEDQRFRSLTAEIARIDDEIAARDAEVEDENQRIDARARAQERADAEARGASTDAAVTPERLTLLLERQDAARQERDTLIGARELIVQRAADRDFTEDEDRDFRLLTTEIAAIDDEIVRRDPEIDTVATLATSIETRRPGGTPTR